MNETRRGFLKTLGKLGAVLGLTAAACSAHHSHHPHHPHPHHRKHPKPPKRRHGEVKRKSFFDYDLKANVRTTQQAKTQDGTLVVTRQATPNVPNGRYGGGFSGFERPDPVSAAQTAINTLNNLRIDLISQSINPDMLVVPAVIYDFYRQKETLVSSNSHVSALRDAAVLKGITD